MFFDRFIFLSSQIPNQQENLNLRNLHSFLSKTFTWKVSKIYSENPPDQNLRTSDSNSIYLLLPSDRGVNAAAGLNNRRHSAETPARARYFYARARVPDLTKRPIFGAVGVVLRTWTVVCEIIPIFFQYLEGEWRFGEREICKFFTGCTSSSSNGNHSKIQATPK